MWRSESQRGIFFRPWEFDGIRSILFKATGLLGFRGFKVMEIHEPQRPTAVYQVVLIVFLGGNSNIFGIFTPKLGEDDFHFDLRIFFRWVASTTNQRSRAKGGGATSSFFHPKKLEVLS